MHTHAIYLPVKVSEEELRQFVESQGGQWQHYPPLSQGLWQWGPRMTVFLRPWPEGWDLADGDPDRLAQVERSLGKPVLSLLTIDRTVGSEAAALARPIIEAIIARWGGEEVDCDA